MNTKDSSLQRTQKEPWIPQLLIGFLFSFTVFIFAPIDMYLMNYSDFWFTLSSFIPMQLALFAATFLIVELVMTLCRRLPHSLYLMILTLLFALTLGLYVQGNYLNAFNEVLDGGTPQWTAKWKDALVNTAIWGAIFVAAICLLILRPKWITKLVSYTSALMLIMLGASLIISLITTDVDTKRRVYTSVNEQFVNSTEGDVILLMLDTLDTRLFDRMLQEDPGHLAELEGFTYYRNNGGTYRKTDASITAMMTGQFYYNEKPFWDYTEEAFANSTFFSDLNDNGITVNMYGESALLNTDLLPLISNLIRRESYIRSPIAFQNVLFKMVAYRYAPVVMQPYFFDQYAEKFADLEEPIAGKPAEHTLKHTAFSESLAEQGIAIDNSGRYFKYIALQGAHTPYRLDPEGSELPNSDGTMYEQALGAMRHVDKYLIALKESGVYDRSTIIIFADHGYSHTLGSPTLLVKPVNQRGELALSNAPTSLIDLRATVMDAFGLDSEAYGRPVRMWEGVTERERLFYVYDWAKISRGDAYMNPMTEYSIPVDGAADLDRYVKTGNVYSAP